MQIVYILSNLNRTAPNTVMINIIKNIDANVEIISLGISSNDSYKNFFENQNIKIYETKNILKIIEICKNKVVHLNGYHPNIAGFFIKLFGKSLKILSTCHSNELDESNAFDFQGLTLFKSKIKHFIQPYFYNFFDLVVAVSYDVQTYLKTIGVKNSTVIYNGIELISLPNIAQGNEINIAQIGHIMPLKNQAYSLKILKALKEKEINIKLNFFGGIRNFGYEMEILKYIAENELFNSVKFYGNLGFDELFYELSKNQICIMPSLSEGLPLSLLEAMSLGLTCIVSNNGGMKEIIKVDFNGLVVDLTRDSDIQKIVTYVSQRKFEQQSQNAKNFVAENFDSKIMAQKYFEIYKD